MRRRVMETFGLNGEDMDKWELINEITIENTTQNISITNDKNGEKFKLSKVEIFIVSMPTEYTSNADISVCVTDARINPIGVGSAAMSTEEKRYCCALFEKKGMGVEHIKTLCSVNGTNSYANMLLKTNGFSLVDENGLVFPDVCEGIWIGSHYQNVLSVGTKITILGVREQKA